MKMPKSAIILLLLLQTTISHAEEINKDKVVGGLEFVAGAYAAGYGKAVELDSVRSGFMKSSPSKPMATYGQAVSASTESWIDGIKGHKTVNEDIIVLGAQKRPTKVSDWPLEPTVSKDGKIRILMDHQTKELIVSNYRAEGGVKRLKIDHQPSGLMHSLFISDNEIVTLEGDGSVRKFSVLTGQQIEFKNAQEFINANNQLMKTDPRFSNAVNFKGRTKIELQNYVTNLNQQRAAANLPPVEIYKTSRLTPVVKALTEAHQKMNYRQMGKGLVGSAVFGTGLGLVADGVKRSNYSKLSEVEGAPAIQSTERRASGAE